jgi:hypothetical protein
MPWSLYPQGNSRRYPLNTRLGGPQTQSWALWSTGKSLESSHAQSLYRLSLFKESDKGTFAWHGTSSGIEWRRQLLYHLPHNNNNNNNLSSITKVLNSLPLSFMVFSSFGLSHLHFTLHRIRHKLLTVLQFNRVMPQARSPLHQNTHKSFRYATQIQECRIPWRHCLTGDLHK